MIDSAQQLSALILAYKAVEDANKALLYARDTCKAQGNLSPKRNDHFTVAYNMLQHDDELFESRLNFYCREIRRLPLDSDYAVLQRMRFEMWGYDEFPLGPKDTAAITAAYDRYVLKRDVDDCIGRMRRPAICVD